MKNTLYLHIGNHKTGTTSIQKILANNSEFLAKHDISFFSENTRDKYVKHGNTNDWISIEPKQLQNGIGGFVKNVDELASKLVDLPHDTVIISAEAFSWIFEKQPIQILHDALSKHFEQIKIIVYLRRQDEQVISHHQQGSKGPDRPEASFYGNDPRAIPLNIAHHHYYMNYYERISLWADIFGDANLIVKIFDKNQLKDHDVVSDFFSILNLSKPEQTLEKLNESNGFERTKVGHLLNNHIENKKLHDHLISYLGNEGKMLPSKIQAQEYYKHYYESNKKLEKRFNVSFDETFDKYPDREQDIWDETNANEAISNLLIAINDYDKRLKSNCLKSFLLCIKYFFRKPKEYL